MVKKKNNSYFAVYNQDDECVGVFEDIEQLRKALNYSTSASLYHKCKIGDGVIYRGEHCKIYKFLKE